MRTPHLRGCLISEADAATVASRDVDAFRDLFGHPAPPPEYVQYAGSRADVSWFTELAGLNHEGGADNQGQNPDCTWFSCLAVTMLAWRRKGVAVPILNSTTGYDLSRTKYHSHDGSTGGLFQEEAFDGAMMCGLWPCGTTWFLVPDNLDDEAVALADVPLIDCEAVTEGGLPEHVRKDNGYFDETAFPDIIGNHSFVRLAMLFDSAGNCWHALDWHWGTQWGVKGVGVYHRTNHEAFRNPRGTWRVVFPAGFESWEGWKQHIPQKGA